MNSREAFEKWITETTSGYPLNRDSEGDYIDDFTAHMWLAWQAVRAQGGEAVAEARTERDSARDAETVCWGELAAAKTENEALRERVAELEEFAADAQKDAWRALDPDYVPPAVESAMKALLHRAASITQEIDPDDIEPSAWLLRKQAEAVLQFVDKQAPRIDLDFPEPLDRNKHCCEFSVYLDRGRINDAAQRLRKQAAEKGGGDDEPA